MGKQLVVTVHGIRTFGQWQERLESLVRRASPMVEFLHYHYGYFSVIAFFIPPFRYLAIVRFRRHLKRLAILYPNRDITIVSHSFGTHLVTWGLVGMKVSDRPRVRTLLLAGSVLKTTFPWGALLDSGAVGRVVNDCGIDDSILLLSQMFVLFTGMAGRTGFSGLTGPRLCNRFFTGGHSSYFLDDAGAPSDTFLKRYWVPFLAGSSELEAVDERRVKGSLQGVALTAMQLADPTKLLVYAILGGLVVYQGYLRPRWDANRSQAESAVRLARSQLEQNTSPESAIAILAGLVGNSSAPGDVMLQLRYGLQRLVHIGALISADGFYRIETEAGADTFLRYRGGVRPAPASDSHTIWLDTRHRVIATLNTGVFRFFSLSETRKPFWIVDIRQREYLDLDIEDSANYGRYRRIGDRRSATLWSPGTPRTTVAFVVEEAADRGYLLIVFDVANRHFDGVFLGQRPVMGPACEYMAPSPFLPAYFKALRKEFVAEMGAQLGQNTPMAYPSLTSDKRVRLGSMTLRELFNGNWSPSVNTSLNLSLFERSLQVCDANNWSLEDEGPSRRVGSVIPYQFPIQRPEETLWTVRRKAATGAAATALAGFRLLAGQESSRLRTTLGDYQLSRAPAAPENEDSSEIHEESDREWLKTGAEAHDLLVSALSTPGNSLQVRREPDGRVVVWSGEVGNFGIREWFVCRWNTTIRCLVSVTDDRGGSPVASPDGRWLLFQGSPLFLGGSIRLLNIPKLRFVGPSDGPKGSAVGIGFDPASTKYIVFTNAGELWVASLAAPEKALLHRFLRPSAYLTAEDVFFHDLHRAELVILGDDVIVEYSRDVFARVGGDGTLKWVSRPP